ncbi:MAG: hypothetical protein JWM27_4843 [Gemmatimonadetes bacterium]|nr:hypothetical protein [Gemmatimonadota bacterium]
MRWPAGEYLSLLERAASAAAGDVCLIAPFVKEAVLRRLLATVPQDIAVTVVTRWRADEVAAGVSDLEVFDRVQERPGARLLLCPSLHAKLYLFGTERAYAGSANLTNAALAEGGNIELLGEFRPVPLSLLRFAEMIQSRSHAAEEIERVRIAAAAEALRRDFPRPPPASAEEQGGLTSDNARGPSWIPRFRHPGELYALYANPDAGAVPDALLAAAHDLARIEPPEGLDYEDFRVAAAAALSTSEFFARLDDYLRTPRFFGPLRSWLEHNIPLTTNDPAATLQILVRWMLWAFPGQYRLEQPRFSERFGRNDADWSLPARRRGRRGYP